MADTPGRDELPCSPLPSAVVLFSQSPTVDLAILHEQPMSLELNGHYAESSLGPVFDFFFIVSPNRGLKEVRWNIALELWVTDLHDGFGIPTRSSRPMATSQSRLRIWHPCPLGTN